MALTRKHKKRNFARPLARARERGSQTRASLCGLDEEEALVSHAQGLGPIPSICRVGCSRTSQICEGASVPLTIVSTTLLMGTTPILLTDRQASKGERQFQWK